uniref:Uncharacterized protein n=1 Tax=Rhizophora mucronata TaxID=61149 RepID=A0A2P2N3N4_RHIMU
MHVDTHMHMCIHTSVIKVTSTNFSCLCCKFIPQEVGLQVWARFSSFWAFDCLW